ncbi:hypothetical protein F5Y19DRAFT_184203 [Xylariaceae sp. FL1651]|nr:hypothetical protein F5Y19DRAFT_184203 [Xylariaceae sp. FL1651]
MSLGVGNVEPNQPDRNYKYNTSRSSLPPTASQVTVVHDPRSKPDVREQPKLPTPSSQMTVIPYAPSPPEAPTFPSVPSEEEIYGPDRYAGNRTDVPDYASSTPRAPPSVHFNPAQFMMGGQTDPLVSRDFKDELTRAAGVVTPGVSDVPYIRYALEALTQRCEDARDASGNTSSESDVGYVPQYQTPPQSNVDVRPPPSVRQTPVALHGDSETWSDSQGIPPSSPNVPAVEQHGRTEERRPSRSSRFEQNPRPAPPDRAFLDQLVEDFDRAKGLVGKGPPDVETNHNPPRTVDVWRAQPDTFTQQDLDAVRYRHPAPPPLTHKPWILRTPSLLLLATLSVLMITALIFSAVYSSGRNGFTTYAHSIYGGQYFLFRVLPQLIGAILLIYAQCIIAAVFRVFPFSAMASDDRRERRNAVFLPLYPRSFLWPQLFGPWNVWLPALVVWLMNFTIPLLSSLFTVVLVDGVWTWSTVQGVAWTLVAVYVSLLLSTVVLFIYWRHRRTGMIETWDVRSIADIIFLVSQSNSLPQYRGLETAATRRKMRKVLDGTAERLGYWTTPEVPENSIFWGFGVPTTKDDLDMEKWDKRNWAAQRNESRPVVFSDVEDQKQPWAVRFRYLPWCFRDSQIIFFVVAGTVLLIALIVVSFVHSTDLRDGFLPGLSAGPMAGAFSPADFLYSFLSSLIGLILFLSFQSLELTLRIMAPWGELAREEGSRAETSLLLDYAACLPWHTTFKALRYKHWRVAFVSFLAPLFILIPVLSGGLFMALTSRSGVVRMYPNVPIFALILTLLFLYLAALISLVPNRKQFRLPHAVTCLAEIMSFCCNEQLRTDEAFDQTKTATRNQLKSALDCGKDWHRQGRWNFGAGKNNEERLGIKRYSKYTVSSKKLLQYDRYVRGKPISGPLLHGSGPLFGR